MTKILIIDGSLKHAHQFVEPFIQRLEVYLSPYAECVDTRVASSFDERTFFEYDQVILTFFNSLDCVPSSMLEIFQRLEGQMDHHPEIYALIACDEYEPEKCDLSEKVIQCWCKRENLEYQGALKIGSALFIMNTPAKFVVSNSIKSFAKNILKQETVNLKTTMLTERQFMKTSRHYWDKEIKKKKKHNRRKQSIKK